ARLDSRHEVRARAARDDAPQSSDGHWRRGAARHRYDGIGVVASIVTRTARSMYEHFYGLSEPPFELTADPKFLFLTPKQREALSTLQYGLSSARSLTVLIGEAGTGKTTLLRAALESERCRHVQCVYLNNPALRVEDFIRLLALRFDLGPDSGESKAI